MRIRSSHLILSTICLITIVCIFYAWMIRGKEDAPRPPRFSIRNVERVGHRYFLTFEVESMDSDQLSILREEEGLPWVMMSFARDGEAIPFQHVGRSMPHSYGNQSYWGHMEPGSRESVRVELHLRDGDTQVYAELAWRAIKTPDDLVDHGGAALSETFVPSSICSSIRKSPLRKRASAFLDRTVPAEYVDAKRLACYECITAYSEYRLESMTAEDRSRYQDCAMNMVERFRPDHERSTVVFAGDLQQLVFDICNEVEYKWW